MIVMQEVKKSRTRVQDLLTSWMTIIWFIVPFICPCVIFASYEKRIKGILTIGSHNGSVPIQDII